MTQPKDEERFRTKTFRRFRSRFSISAYVLLLRMASLPPICSPSNRQRIGAGADSAHPNCHYSVANKSTDTRYFGIDRFAKQQQSSQCQGHEIRSDRPHRCRPLSSPLTPMIPVNNRKRWQLTRQLELRDRVQKENLLCLHRPPLLMLP